MLTDAPPQEETAAELTTLRHRANHLRGPNATQTPDVTLIGRPEAECLHHVIDAHQTLSHEGDAAPLAEPLPDFIPMTGEEDPLVEVEDAQFVSIVAEFMRSERNARDAPAADARTCLAHALLPFADRDYDAQDLLAAITSPFARYVDATVANNGPAPHLKDVALVATLTRIIDRAIDPDATPPTGD